MSCIKSGITVDELFANPGNWISKALVSNPKREGRPPVTHTITERKNPMGYMLICSCGWSHRETARQNAWARAAKLRAAERRHFEAVQAD